MNDISDFLSVHPEVAEAITHDQPVVALESTIISHGMPYPQNVETARSLEQIVRDAGAIPATIAILDGQITVGLSAEQLEKLGKSGNVTKCSRRDLPVVLAKGLTGATTVAATMIIAEMAGVRVFATGGIGGVHRGADKSMDISADLRELSRANVAVVSAGVKAILDIGLTLEYLETEGVPVLGYRTEIFPAFYTRDSGFAVEWRCETAKEIAQAMQIKWGMGLRGGLLIANPIPTDGEMQFRPAQAAIDQAIAEAEAQEISGKALTPFLLARINELTKGMSLESNIALVRNNARLAAEISVAYAGLDPNPMLPPFNRSYN